MFLRLSQPSLSLSLAAMPLSRRASGLREGEAARAKEERGSGEREMDVLRETLLRRDNTLAFSRYTTSLLTHPVSSERFVLELLM